MPSSRRNWSRSRPSPAVYGRRSERIAAWRLRLAGLRVVGRNVRVAGKEVDLLARRGGLLVVCEVKARRSVAFGEPIDAVGPEKRRRLVAAGDLLLARDPTLHEVRFDVVEVRGMRVRHLPGAF